MKINLNIFIICTLAGLLAACGTVTAPPAAPTATTQQFVIPSQAAPTLAIPSPAATPLPATDTALPPVEAQIPGPVISLSQVHMLNAKNGWGWSSKPDGSSILLRTDDGGQTWLDVSPQDKPASYYSFFLDPKVGWLLYSDPATNAAGYLRTLDGGKTWEKLPTNDILQMSQAVFTSPDDGVAEAAGVGAGNLYLNYYETHDGGASWEPILLAAPSPEPGLQPGTIHLCNICGDTLYYDETRMLIAYGSMANEPPGVFSVSISTDNGQHWKNLKLPLPDKKYARGMLAPQSPFFSGQVGLLPVNIMDYGSDGSVAYSILVVYTTLDGGQTWTAAPGILETNSISDTVRFINAEVAFVRCGKNLCSTTDGAHSWQTLPNTLDFDMTNGGSDYVYQFAFTSPLDGWAISGMDPTTSLWHTTDGGLSWTKLSPTLVH